MLLFSFCVFVLFSLVFSTSCASASVPIETSVACDDLSPAAGRVSAHLSTDRATLAPHLPRLVLGPGRGYVPPGKSLGEVFENHKFATEIETGFVPTVHESGDVCPMLIVSSRIHSVLIPAEHTLEDGRRLPLEVRVEYNYACIGITITTVVSRLFDVGDAAHPELAALIDARRPVAPRRLVGDGTRGGYFMYRVPEWEKSMNWSRTEDTELRQRLAVTMLVMATPASASRAQIEALRALPRNAPAKRGPCLSSAVDVNLGERAVIKSRPEPSHTYDASFERVRRDSPMYEDVDYYLRVKWCLLFGQIAEPGVDTPAEDVKNMLVCSGGCRERNKCPPFIARMKGENAQVYSGQPLKHAQLERFDPQW